VTNKYVLICLSLLVSLFIYLFYRTDRTLVNELVIRILSINTYTNLKSQIVKELPLNNIVIYSLPEGLWVFCVTLTSKPFYIRLNDRRFDCLFIPLIYCISLELFQLFHITNGRFDFMDIGVSVLFWLLGGYVLGDESEKQDVFTRPNSRTIICVASYCIVYLSHVFR